MGAKLGKQCVATYGFGGRRALATFGFGEDASEITFLEQVDFTLDMEPTAFEFILDSHVLTVTQPSYKELDNLYTATGSNVWAYGNVEFYAQLFQADTTGTITKIQIPLAWAYSVPTDPVRIGICACNQGTHHPLNPETWIGTYAEVAGSTLAEYPTMTTVDVDVNCPVVAGTWYGLLIWSNEGSAEYRTRYTAGQSGVPGEECHVTFNGGSTWNPIGGNTDIPCYAEQEERDVFLVANTLDMEPTAFDFTLDMEPTAFEYTLDVEETTVEFTLDVIE